MDRPSCLVPQSEVLLSALSFSVTSLPGNCGTRHVYRLLGSYTYPRYIESVRNERKTWNAATSYFGPTGPETVMLAHYPAALNAINSHLMAPSALLGIPVELGFAIVAGQLNTGNYAFLTGSDSDGHGDGHKGAFRTAEFFRWLLRYELAQGEPVAAPRVYSGDGNPTTEWDMLAWVLVPNPRRLVEITRWAHNELSRIFKEYHNEPKVQATLAQASKPRKVRVTTARGSTITGRWAANDLERVQAQTLAIRLAGGQPAPDRQRGLEALYTAIRDGERWTEHAGDVPAPQVEPAEPIEYDDWEPPEQWGPEDDDIADDVGQG